VAIDFIETWKAAGPNARDIFLMQKLQSVMSSLVETIQNVVDGNGVPTGQRGLVMWFRTGSDSVADNGFRLLRNT
jgi:predicted phage gp36 major capsid-like protein